jgi:fermentation-respiration switch protein FrsA (DUF1100 family)
VDEPLSGGGRRTTFVRAIATLGSFALIAFAASEIAWPRVTHALTLHRSAGGATSLPTAAAPAPTTTTTSTIPVAAMIAPATRPYMVDQSSIVLTDATREPSSRGTQPTSARAMRVLVLRPEGATGALPLVVFAHGFESEPEVYLPLLESWAEAGYLVAAPELPGSARDLDGPPAPDDVAEAARDLSFVVTELLAGDAGAVDASRVAVAGHSDGGSSVAALALNTAYRDPRIGAYLVLSGVIAPSITDGTWGGGSGEPLLVVVGTDDEYGDLAGSTTVYQRADDPKTLVTVPGGDHLDIYVGAGPVADGVRADTTAFLDASLARPQRRRVQ